MGAMIMHTTFSALDRSDRHMLKRRLAESSHLTRQLHNLATLSREHCGLNIDEDDFETLIAKDDVAEVLLDLGYPYEQQLGLFRVVSAGRSRMRLGDFLQGVLMLRGAATGIALQKGVGELRGEQRSSSHAIVANSKLIFQELQVVKGM